MQQRRTAVSRRRRRWARGAALLVAALVVASCGDGDDRGSDRASEGAAAKPRSGASTAGTPGPGDLLPGSDLGGEAAPGLGHVHGLGVNPSDGSTLIATHFGLWKLAKGGEPVRVGDNVHDLMGFSVVGPDRFVASGHPNGAPSLPGLLGLVETTDAGATWRSVSLMGDADFHALRTSGPRTYGLNSGDGVLMSSDDRTEWSSDSAPVPLVDFAVRPGAPDSLVGAIARSETKLETSRSIDGGRTWTRVSGAPQLLRFAWRTPRALWGFDPTGGVYRSVDDGRTWKRTGALGAPPEAVVDTGSALVAAAGGAILQSVDGVRWQELHRYAQ